MMLLRVRAELHHRCAAGTTENAAGGSGNSAVLQGPVGKVTVGKAVEFVLLEKGDVFLNGARLDGCKRRTVARDVVELVFFMLRSRETGIVVCVAMIRRLRRVLVRLFCFRNRHHRARH